MNERTPVINILRFAIGSSPLVGSTVTSNFFVFIAHVPSHLGFLARSPALTFVLQLVRLLETVTPFLNSSGILFQVVIAHSSPRST